MKAITLWQPWATAIALGLKKYETRDWPAVCDGKAFTGWILITAAKAQHDEGVFRWIQHKMPDAPKTMESGPNMSRRLEYYAAIKDFLTLPFGSAVALAYLEKSHAVEELAPGQISEQERSWGLYEPGRFAWEFSEIYSFDEPFPVIGRQKIFNLSSINILDRATTLIYKKQTEPHDPNRQTVPSSQSGSAGL